MNALKSDYIGFLKFLTRARKDIISWFAPNSNSNAQRIIIMAAREWDGMDEKEKSHFLLAAQSNIPDDVKPSGSACDALNDRHHKGSSRNSSVEGDRSFIPAETCMDHVIKHRSKLHEQYKPLELNVLELLLKTKPARPLPARVWYRRLNNRSSSGIVSDKNWNTLEDSEKHIYDACAVLDQKRFKFEKSVWLTKLASLDLNDENLSLDDFKSLQSKYTIEALFSNLKTIGKPIPVELRKNIKRPREPFSLFIEYHCYQLGYRKGEFRFANHLRSSAEAWQKLSEKQKEEFREQSRKLKVARKKERSSENAELFGMIPNNLFKITRTATDPPCHPTHLLPYKPRNIIQFYGRSNSIPKAEWKKSWDNLTQKDKESYEKKYEGLLKSIDEQKDLIQDRVASVKKLLRDTNKLKKLKIEYELISR